MKALIIVVVAVVALGGGGYGGYTMGYSGGEEAGYDGGYSAGQEVGYSQGHEEGYDEGEDEGYTEGYDSGKDEGYAEGRNAGYISGKKDGRAEGYTSGKTEGYAEGIAKGQQEGYGQGYATGHDEGYSEGLEAGGEGYTIRDPTYAEVIAFLLTDTTNSNEYSDPTYVCDHFSRDVCNNAEDAGFRCAFVGLRYPEGSGGHSIIAFNTSDRGLVYFEPQTDDRVEPAVGEKFHECVEGQPFAPPPYDDTIDDILVIW